MRHNLSLFASRDNSLNDPFLMQELFDQVKLMKRCSLKICTQINPFDWVKVFSVSGIGESSRALILELCKNIHLQGADLRIVGKY